MKPLKPVKLSCKCSSVLMMLHQSLRRHQFVCMCPQCLAALLSGAYVFHQVTVLTQRVRSSCLPGSVGPQTFLGFYYKTLPRSQKRSPRVRLQLSLRWLSAAWICSWEAGTWKPGVGTEPADNGSFWAPMYHGSAAAEGFWQRLSML